MDNTIERKPILRIAAKRVLENLCVGNVVFLSKPEPSARTVSPSWMPSKAGYPLDKHHHSEIVQIIHGRGRLKLSKGSLDLSPDKIVFISPETLHGETYWKQGSPYTLLWIIFFPTGISFFISEYNGQSFTIRPERYLLDTLPSDSLWTVTTARDLSTDLLNRARIQEYLIHACCELAERPEDHEEVPDYSQKLAEQIRSYIDLHYTEPILVNELAQIARCSPNHLNTLFRKHVGIPVHQYILQQRLQEAKRLLENSEYTIKEVAYRMGFNDPLYFSRIFRKYFLHPPSKRC
jgi:AraC-like DNA-binding protein